MTKIINTNYHFRYLARVIIEAETPLAVGSGESDFMTDSQIATDVNGLPYIPGSAIAGVVRSMIGKSEADTFFGFQEDRNIGEGSKIIFTEAKILNSEGVVMDGLIGNGVFYDSLLTYYKGLPIRQHVRIDAKGVATNGGKFDEQVVYSGTRFCFELEMIGGKEEKKSFDMALSQIKDQSFRIGGGTRKGFGKMKVVSLKTQILDIEDKMQFEQYVKKPSALNTDFWNAISEFEGIGSRQQKWNCYSLELNPLDFFHIGSGFGDDEVDMTPVKASKVKWQNGKAVLVQNLVLIPATSLKGALAHRTAYHWNRLHGYFSGDTNATVGNDNPAIRLLFGYEDQDKKRQHRGNVLFSDIIQPAAIDKVINHVKIDRFTGGAPKGALFSEKTTYGKGGCYSTDIWIATKDDCCYDKDKRQQDVNLANYAKAIEAFECAIRDLCNCQLPLGGGVNRGHGVFEGHCTKPNGEKLI